jgi:NH3-dependent NAD+ synthetase
VAKAYYIILIKELIKKVLVSFINIYYSKLCIKHIQKTYSLLTKMFIQKQYKIIKKRLKQRHRQKTQLVIAQQKGSHKGDTC